MTDDPSITVTLRFFGALSESVSADSIQRTLPARSTLDDLRQALVREHPDEARLAACMIAVNAEYRDGDVALADGDEIAMIPPVSGG